MLNLQTFNMLSLMRESWGRQTAALPSESDENLRSSYDVPPYSDVADAPHSPGCGRRPSFGNNMLSPP